MIVRTWPGLIHRDTDIHLAENATLLAGGSWLHDLSIVFNYCHREHSSIAIPSSLATL